MNEKFQPAFGWAETFSFLQKPLDKYWYRQYNANG